MSLARQFPFLKIMPSDYITVGYCQLIRCTELNHLRLTEDHIKILECEGWIIPLGSYYTRQWNQVFSVMQSSTAAQLSISYINKWTIEGNGNILGEISHIQWHCLKVLQFYNVDILTIEPLSYLEAYNLTSLSLIYTHVTSMRPLKKTCFFRLEKIFIYSSVRKSVNIADIVCNVNQFFELGIEEFPRDTCQFQNIAPLAKFYKNEQSRNRNILIKLKTQRVHCTQLYQKFQDKKNFLFKVKLTYVPSAYNFPKSLNKELPSQNDYAQQFLRESLLQRNNNEFPQNINRPPQRVNYVPMNRRQTSQSNNQRQQYSLQQQYNFSQVKNKSMQHSQLQQRPNQTQQGQQQSLKRQKPDQTYSQNFSSYHEPQRYTQLATLTQATQTDHIVQFISTGTQYNLEEIESVESDQQQEDYQWLDEKFQEAQSRFRNYAEIEQLKRLRIYRESFWFLSQRGAFDSDQDLSDNDDYISWLYE